MQINLYNIYPALYRELCNRGFGNTVFWKTHKSVKLLIGYSIEAVHLAHIALFESSILAFLVSKA